MLSTLSQYVIPRKVAVPQPDEINEDAFRLVEVPSTSEKFKEIFVPVITSRLSPYVPCKSSVKVVECYSVVNPQLEKKFESFRSKLLAAGLSSDVSYGFMIVGDNTREVDVIVKEGIWTGNVAVGDLGTPKKGVYLSESPDLTTPAPFIDETTALRVFAFKILKGQTRHVELGSYEIDPTPGYSSHVPVAATDAASLTRHELYRYNQVYLFEQLDSEKFASRPSNILPFALFSVEFASASRNISKKVPTTVWKGQILIKDRLYGGLQLISSLGVSTKPFLLQSPMKVEQLVDWATCIRSPLMVELLAAPLVGELAVKKELILKRHQRFVTYFTLESEEYNEEFKRFFDFMRIQSLAAFVDLDGFSSLVLIPNGFLSILLALPFKSNCVFHCVYVSSISLLHGQFIPLSNSETVEFDTEPLLGSKVDGIDIAVHRIAREVFPTEWLKKGGAGEDDDSPPLVTEPFHGNSSEMTPESHSPVDMEIDKTDDESQKLQVTLSSRPGGANVVNNEKVPRNTSDVSQKSFVQISQRAPDPRRKRRIQLHKDLPLPKLTRKPLDEHIAPTTEMPFEDKCQSAVKSEVSASNINVESDEGASLIIRCHTPYSPSKPLSDDDNSSENQAGKEEAKKESSSSVIEKLSSPDYVESPASPPPEDGVYVAPASKIIPVSNELHQFDPAVQASSKIYRPPQISLFPDTMRNFQLSEVGVKTLQELKKAATDGGSGSARGFDALKLLEPMKSKADEDERLRLKPSVLAILKSSGMSDDRYPSHNAVFRKNEEDEDLLKVSSKDVDLRFMNIGSIQTSTNIASQQTTRTSANNAEKRVGISAAFISAKNDKDDRLLVPPRAKEQNFGSIQGRTSYLPPTTSAANEKTFDKAPLSSIVHCSYPFPPPKSCQIPKSQTVRNIPLPSGSSGQKDVALPKHLPFPSLPIGVSSTRPSLSAGNQPCAPSSTGNQSRSSGSEHISFGFFNSSLPKPRALTSSFQTNASSRDKIFFPRVPFPATYVGRPGLKNSSVAAQHGNLVSSIQSPSSSGLEARPRDAKRGLIPSNDRLFFQGPS